MGGAADLVAQRRLRHERGAAQVERADARLLRGLRDGPRHDPDWPPPSGAHRLRVVALLFDERHSMAGMVTGVVVAFVALVLSSLFGIALPNR